MNIVTPCCSKRVRISRIWRRPTGSTPSVGSSRISSDGRMDQRLRQPQALQHALRILAEPEGAPLGQAHQLEQLGNQLLAARGVHARKSGVKIQHAGAGKVRGKAMVLGQVPDGTPGFGFAGIAAENQSIAGGRMHRRQQQLDEGGLARAVRAEQSENGAARHAQRDVVYRRHFAPRPTGAIDLRQAAGLDGVLGLPLTSCIRRIRGKGLFPEPAGRRAEASDRVRIARDMS